MTGWRKLVNGAALVIAIGAIWTWWSSYTSLTALDRAIIQSGRTHGEISDLVAGHLPGDLNGAIQGLRDMGFEEGDRYVGASYRRRPIPERNEANRAESGTIRYYNGILDEHDAIVVKPFRKKIVLFNARDFSIIVELLTMRDGTMKVYASSYTPIIFP